MKKLLALCLLSFALLQSCTQNELDVAPKQVSSITSAFNFESAAKQISETFVLSGAKALLLKPIDANPNTHLTTLFYADAKGRISPLIENFEVKQVEVTASGIYVLTNYMDEGEPIAFFVKYDNSWVQLKGLNGIDNFQFIIENGDIVFTNDAMTIQKVFNTRTLTFGQEGLVNPWGHIGAIYLSGANGKYTFTNITTGESQVVTLPEYEHINNFIPLKYNAMVLIDLSSPDKPDANHQLLNMKTGEVTDANLIHEEMYSLPGSAVPNAKGDGIVYLSQGTRYWEYSAQWSGLHYTEVVYKGSTVEEVKQNKFYNPFLPTPKPEHLVYLDSQLVSGYSYKVVDNLIYYSGVSKSGKPATGVYDMISTTNIIVDEKETFSSVHPF